jgi:glycosyltransferase involved in cell wall biosynthesis
MVDVYGRSWYTGTHADTLVEGVAVRIVPSIHTKHLDTITYTLMATIAAMRSSAEILHYHGVGPSLLSWIPRVFAPQKKVITTFHSIDRKHAKWGGVAKIALTLGEWAACKFAHQTIAVSRTIQQYSRDVYDATTVYIPNGVEHLEKITSTKTLEQYDLTTQEYIIALSRLIPHKGMHFLISAYTELSKTNSAALRGKKLVIVGDGSYTDSYVAQLKSLAEGNSNIIFTGFQSGIALQELMSHAFLYVHPSTNEGLPITVLEAMSYGLPTLLSDIPEHLELCQDKRFLFRSEQVEHLKEQMNLLLHEPTLRQESSIQNKAVIESTYSWDHVTAAILKVYAEVRTNAATSSPTMYQQSI